MKNLRQQYLKYLKKWHASHQEGDPASFEEWYDQEREVIQIAALNDAARGNPLSYMLTRGVAALPAETISDIYISVQSYEEFTEDNDPHGEHDFGSLVMDGNQVFWKIDYYTKDLSGGCDPLDPNCRRVVTIMLAEEW